MLEWDFDYAGPAADAEKLLGPFNAIKAIQVGSSEASYPIVSGADDTECPKAKYDPQNRFRYFEPIVSGST